MQEIVLSSEEDAQKVLDVLRKLGIHYSQVTVADYLELVGVSSVYSDTTIGWTELGDVSIGRTKNGGYVLNLPEPKKLNVSRGAFPFLKGWWFVIDVPNDQIYEGRLIDELGGTMILEIEPNKRHGIAMSTINKIDAYRERPAKSE